jgi:hypothetical protein
MHSVFYGKSCDIGRGNQAGGRILTCPPFSLTFDCSTPTSSINLSTKQCVDNGLIIGELPKKNLDFQGEFSFPKVARIS